MNEKEIKKLQDMYQKDAIPHICTNCKKEFYGLGIHEFNLNYSLGMIPYAEFCCEKCAKEFYSKGEK